MRLRIRVARRHVDVPGQLVERRGVTQVRLEHRIQLARVGAITVAPLAGFDFGVQGARVEDLLGDLGDVVAQVDGGLQPRQEGQVVVRLHVADAAVGRAFRLGQIQNLQRVVRGREVVPGPIVVAGGRGGIVHRLRRPHLDGVGKHGAGREPVELARALQIGAHAQAVVEESLLVVDSQRLPLHGGALDDAVLVQVAHRKAVAVLISRARNHHVMLLADPGAVHQIEPVGARVAELTDLRRIRVREHGCPELRGVQYRRQPGHGRGGHAPGILDLRLAPPRFRPDEDDAIGGVHAIDRGGRGVLEHGDALDIVRIQEVQGIAPGRWVEAVATDRYAPAGAGAERHAVNDVQRLAAGVDGGRAANPDRQVAARLVVVHELHAGNFVLDELLRTDEAAVVEFGSRHLLHGSRDVARPLLSVAGHDDFRQAHRLGGQGEVDDDRVAPHDRDGLLGRRVPDHSRPQGVRAGGDARDEVAAVRLGQHAVAADRDRDSGERLVRRVVRDASADRTGRLLRAELGHPTQTPGERENKPPN